MNRRMLSKEEEGAGDEVEVRREDQDKINKFSRLHQKELKLEEALKGKSPGRMLQKEKEELDDITTELELADEDDLVPYKIGDAFFHVSLEQAQEMLSSANSKIEDEVSLLEDNMSTVKEEMTQLKVELYARFGRSINLET
ncbi:putative Gim complex component GIM3-like protein [Seiridium cardinale]|uniref:Prefoldin subunit 4 n=1 Tax=Seiridium cardinale TaxID=138064 RepID=A0ABR2X6F9_9PEZI